MELLHACCRTSTPSLSRLLPPSSEQEWPQDSEGKVKKKPPSVINISICTLPRLWGALRRPPGLNDERVRSKTTRQTKVWELQLKGRPFNHRLTHWEFAAPAATDTNKHVSQSPIKNSFFPPRMTVGSAECIQPDTRSEQDKPACAVHTYGCLCLWLTSATLWEHITLKGQKWDGGCCALLRERNVLQAASGGKQEMGK